jgi:N6-adenosine-specific RNA methylase IME4
MAEMDLRCQDVRAMIASLPDRCAAFVMADPPWPYSDGGPPMGKRRDAPNLRGIAKCYYHGLDEATIAEHLAMTHRIAASDCYLAVWCTFPKIFEWAAHDAIVRQSGWRYVTGAAWGKTGGAWGVGFHFRGDAELCLLYKKGNPRPLTGSASNLWLTGEDAPGGLWLEARSRHSEKPQTALRALVSMAAPVGGLVVDCYAGESASLARACRVLGRRYVGAELDQARHQRALVRLSQQEMLLEATA